MAIDWWRSYHGAPTDPKWIPVARRAGTFPGVVSAVWFALEDYASQNEDRGSVSGFDVETYSAFSGWEEETVRDVIAALQAKGLINSEGLLSAWARRQPKTEDLTAADRKRRQREKMRESGAESDKDNVTRGHAASRGVTPDKKRLEEKRELHPVTDVTEPGARAAAHTNGKAPGADQRAVMASIAPAIREHFWIGGKPPVSVRRSNGEPWDEGDEITAALQILEREKGRYDLEDLVGAISVTKAVHGFGPEVPLTLKFLNDKKHPERLVDAVAYWRSRQLGKSAVRTLKRLGELGTRND